MPVNANMGMNAIKTQQMNVDIFGSGQRTGPLSGFLKQGNMGNYGMQIGGGGTEENYNYSIPQDAFYSASNLHYLQNNPPSGF